MAKKPMRTATGRGLDRATTANAKMNTKFDAISGVKGKYPLGPSGIAKLNAEEKKLRADSARIKTSGERMARAQAMAAAKQKPK